MSFSLSYLGYVSCWCSLVPFLAVPSACRVPCAGWLRGFGRCACSFSQGYDACAKIRKNPIIPAFFLVYLSSVCFLPAFSSVFPSFSFFSCGLLLALAEYFLVHPTFRVMRQSCRAYSLRVKYRSSLNPYALRFITFILLLIPSTFPVEI